MLDDDGDEGSRAYEVGYGRPPKHRRFRKGHSGNPGGRKKGSRALKTDLDAALKATLTINVGGKKRKDTTQALAMYALAVKAATGDLRAARLLADLVMSVFGSGDRGGAETKLSKQEEVLLERMLGRLAPEEAPTENPTDGPAGDTSGSDDDREQS